MKRFVSVLHMYICCMLLVSYVVRAGNSCMMVIDYFRLKTISKNCIFFMEVVCGISWKKMKFLLKDGFRPV